MVIWANFYGFYRRARSWVAPIFSTAPCADPLLLSVGAFWVCVAQSRDASAFISFSLLGWGRHLVGVIVV